MLDLARSRSLQIQHHRLGAMPDNRGTDFLVRASQMNGIKMLGETDRQSLCSSGVILEEDYTKWFHIDPPDVTAFARWPWLRQQTATTGVISSERDSVTCATLSRPGARTVQLGAFRSRSE